MTGTTSEWRRHCRPEHSAAPPAVNDDDNYTLLCLESGAEVALEFDPVCPGQRRPPRLDMAARVQLAMNYCFVYAAFIRE